MNPTMKKTLIASSVTLALGVPAAQAALVTDVFGPYTWYTDSANFTMLDSAGGVVGGTNDVAMSWDGNAYSDISDYTGPASAANITAASTTLFFGHAWTAHAIQVFTPGTYTFDVTAGAHPSDGESGTLTMTVATGQLGMHMLFNWNTAVNIDVVVVANPMSIFGSGLLYSTTTNTKGEFKCDTKFSGTLVKNCLYDGPAYGGDGQPTKDQVWMMASMDDDGDGVMGVPMPTGGPFEGFNANFNANLTGTPKPSEIPVPAAVWLFGSGLLGLVGIARRKKKA
jgi:hypothetical protein